MKINILEAQGPGFDPQHHHYVKKETGKEKERERERKSQTTEYTLAVYTEAELAWKQRTKQLL